MGIRTNCLVIEIYSVGIFNLYWNVAIHLTLYSRQANMRRVKHALSQGYSRLHFAIVALALVGAMWANIDLHQHQEGLSTQCVTCSLEKPIASGFFMQQAAALPTMAWQLLTLDNWQVEDGISSDVQLFSIRAPPFFNFTT